jgi:hypothetical protein
MLDEELLRRALTAYADCRAPAHQATPSPRRSLRLGVLLVVALLVGAGSAVAAQRVVLQPLGIFASDPDSAPAPDRAFIAAINNTGVPFKIVTAGLVLQRREQNGLVRVYATTNTDGSHGMGISEEGIPAGYTCCASAATAADPVTIGAQLGKSTTPVAYGNAWAGWVGAQTASVTLLYSDGTREAAAVEDGYFLATDHAPAGTQPVQLIARADDGSELGRVPVARA